MNSREHVKLVGVEDGLHDRVAEDESPVRRVLEVVGLDIVPYPLDGLGTRETLFMKKRAERVTFRVSKPGLLLPSLSPQDELLVKGSTATTALLLWLAVTRIRIFDITCAALLHLVLLGLLLWCWRRRASASAGTAGGSIVLGLHAGRHGRIRLDLVTALAGGLLGLGLAFDERFRLGTRRGVSARVRCARVRIGREGLVILILALAIAASSQLLVDLANLAMVSVTSGLGGSATHALVNLATVFLDGSRLLAVGDELLAYRLGRAVTLGQFGFAWATHKCHSHGGEVASFKNLPDTRDQADDVLLLFVLDGRHKHELYLQRTWHWMV